MRPETTASCGKLARGADTGMWVSGGFRDTCRRALAAGLYHTRLLQVARRFEGTHELCSVPGARWPRLRRFAGPKFGILCYHRVGTEGVPLFSRLSRNVFETQMRYIREHYRVVSLGQLCRELQEGHAVPPTLAVTFDDGYRDLYTYALPVLQKYQIPATVYLIGRCMETGEAPWYDRVFAAVEAAPGAWLEMELDGPRRLELSSPATRLRAAWEIVCYLRSVSDSWRREWFAGFEQRMKPPAEKLENRMLNWEQVRTMERGGVSFGAHTMTHPVVSRLEPEAFGKELLESKQLLENGLGACMADFAYPFGKPEDCGFAAEEFLKSCGYRSAVTTIDCFNAADTDRLRLRRLQIDENWSTTDFAFHLSRLFFQPSGDLAAFSSGGSTSGESHAGSVGV